MHSWNVEKKTGKENVLKGVKVFDAILRLVRGMHLTVTLSNIYGILVK